MTILRCSGKYVTGRIANLLLHQTAKECLKLVNKRISSGTVFMVHGVYAIFGTDKKSVSKEMNKEATVTVSLVN